MRVLALLLTALATIAAAPYHPGLIRLTVQDTEPFETFIWYPTETPEAENRIGPFPIHATLGAPVAADRTFPLVLFSHDSGGSPLLHRDLAASLARAGFIVVAPIQIGDSTGHTEGRAAGRQLMDRPRQAILALNAALADPRLALRVDPARIGMIGYSAGGYTTLVLAGARPDFALAASYCQAHPEDHGSCGDGSPHARHAGLLAWQPPVEPRLKAIVLIDPLAIVFDAHALAAVHVPALLLRPTDNSHQGAEANAGAVAAGLVPPPELVVVPGAHFVFVDPCPPALLAQAPAVCIDAQGVDRAAIHRQIETQIAAFLHRTL
ncbi:MAG: dienelactone hydrolase family protein [Acetobacteraceae bacterium]|nr:dienelactone hydrolase family protein [Acetobacteraceae bacterium]